jgi:GNAT superfamily N-acetyltransferase
MEFENLNKDKLQEIMKTAIAYRITFSTKPWLEVSRGPECGSFYGPDNQPGSICPCGCGKLEEAYPIIKTTGYIRGEISKQNPIALTSSKDRKLIAFGWGYVETGEEFASQKYKSESARTVVAETVGRNKTVFYLSEFGVIPEERGKGIGSEITKKVIEEASKLNLPFLLRTNKSSFMSKIAIKLEMTSIMGSPNTPVDPENSERILYYKE